MAAVRKDREPIVPKMPRTIITRVARGTGFYLCTYLNVWVPDHVGQDGKTTGMSFSKHRKTIGRIDTEDGLGYVRLYESFLEENPSFRNYMVKRVGPSKFELIPITPGMDLSPIAPPVSRRGQSRSRVEAAPDASLAVPAADRNDEPAVDESADIPAARSRSGTASVRPAAPRTRCARKSSARSDR